MEKCRLHLGRRERQFCIAFQCLGGRERKIEEAISCRGESKHRVSSEAIQKERKGQILDVGVRRAEQHEFV